MTHVRLGWLAIALSLGATAIAFPAPTGIPAFDLGDDPASFASLETGPNGIAFARVGALTLALGEDRPASLAIDPLNLFAYLGTFTPAARIVKVDLATFERVGAIESGEDYLAYPVIDPANGFAYFGTTVPTGESATHPARIVKVDLATFTRVDTLELGVGEDRTGGAVIANGFAYFGTVTNPGRVVKIDLATFTRVDAITLAEGENWLASAVLDPTAGFAYFGTWLTSPARIVKVDLGTFERVGAITLEGADGDLRSALIDPIAGFAYFGTGRVVKVNLATFERVDAITLAPGETTGRAAVIDPANGFAYFGTPGIPARVVKVRLDPLERMDAITLTSGENNLFYAAIYPESGFGYFATDTSPGRVVKIYAGPDAISPAISGVAASPDPAEFGEAVTVSATVTDDFRVGSVALEIFDPDGVSMGVSPMTQGAVDSYTFAIEPDSLGTHTFRITAVDSAGNDVMSDGSFVVQDTTAPDITVPSDIVTEATGAGGAAVTYTASATDLVDPSPAVVCAPSSGSTFPLAVTTVTCTAIDDAGNSGTASFTVTVQDTTFPALTVPGDRTVNATAPDGAIVEYEATATDLVGGETAPTCDPPPGSLFPVGTTLVTCTATDSAGNTASDTFTVTVNPSSTGVSPLVLSIGIGVAVAAIAAVGLYAVWRRRKT